MEVKDRFWGIQSQVQTSSLAPQKLRDDEDDENNTELIPVDSAEEEDNGVMLCPRHRIITEGINPKMVTNKAHHKSCDH